MHGRLYFVLKYLRSRPFLTPFCLLVRFPLCVVKHHPGNARFHQYARAQQAAAAGTTVQGQHNPTAQMGGGNGGVGRSRETGRPKSRPLLVTGGLP